MFINYIAVIYWWSQLHIVCEH